MRLHGVRFAAHGDAIGIAVTADDALWQSLAKEALQRPEGDSVSALQAATLNALTIDKSTVRRFEIDQIVGAARLFEELSVEVGNKIFIQHHSVCGRATNGETIFENFEDEFIAISKLEGQMRHATGAETESCK